MEYLFKSKNRSYPTYILAVGINEAIALHAQRFPQDTLVEIHTFDDKLQCRLHGQFHVKAHLEALELEKVIEDVSPKRSLLSLPRKKAARRV